jgi:hypothetical protein
VPIFFFQPMRRDMHSVLFTMTYLTTRCYEWDPRLLTTLTGILEDFHRPGTVVSKEKPYFWIAFKITRSQYDANLRPNNTLPVDTPTISDNFLFSRCDVIITFCRNTEGACPFGRLKGVVEYLVPSLFCCVRCH